MVVAQTGETRYLRYAAAGNCECHFSLSCGVSAGLERDSPAPESFLYRHCGTRRMVSLVCSCEAFRAGRAGGGVPRNRGGGLRHAHRAVSFAENARADGRGVVFPFLGIE